MAQTPLLHGDGHVLPLEALVSSGVGGRHGRSRPGLVGAELRPLRPALLSALVWKGGPVGFVALSPASFLWVPVPRAWVAYTLLPLISTCVSWNKSAPVCLAS